MLWLAAASGCSRPGGSLYVAPTPADRSRLPRPWLRRVLAIRRRLLSLIVPRPSDSPRLLSSTAPFPGDAWSLAPRRTTVEINLHAKLRSKEHLSLSYCVNRHASLICLFFARVFRATRARMPRGARSAIRRSSPRRLRITAAMPAARRERQRRRAPVPKRQMPSTILLFCCRGTACSCSGAKGRRMEGRKKRRTRQRLRDPSARESRE